MADAQDEVEKVADAQDAQDDRSVLKSIDDLTRGALATMEPQKVERTVRLAAAQAKQAGVTIDAMVELVARTADYAESLGLDRSIGAEAAIRALGFVAALGEVGRLDIAAPGRGSKDEYMLRDARLRVAAANSPMARVLAVMRRYEEEMGGTLGGRARALWDAAERGDLAEATTDPNVAVNMIVESGMLYETARLLMDDREGTLPVIQRYGIADMVRAGQLEDSRQVAALAFVGNIRSRLLDLGTSFEQAQGPANRLAFAMVDAFFAGDRAKTATEAGRREVVAQVAHATFSDAELRRLRLDEQSVNEMGIQCYAAFGHLAERHMGLTAQKTLDLMNPHVLRNADERRRKAQLDVDRQAREGLQARGQGKVRKDARAE